VHFFERSIDLFLKRFRKKDRQDRRIDAARIPFRVGRGPTSSASGFCAAEKKGPAALQNREREISLEYGEAEMELHIDAITRGEQII